MDVDEPTAPENATMNDGQREFWETFKDIKCNEIYSRRLSSFYRKCDLILEIILVSVSCYAFTQWLKSKQSGDIFVYALLAIQMGSAVKHLIPFKNNSASMLSLHNDMMEIATRAQDMWYEVRKGEVSEKKSHGLAIKLIQDQNDAIKKNVKGIGIPYWKFIMKSSIQETIECMGKFLNNGEG